MPYPGDWLPVSSEGPHWPLQVQKWRHIMGRRSRHPKAVAKAASVVTFAAPRPGWTFASQRRGLGSTMCWDSHLSVQPRLRRMAQGEVDGRLALVTDLHLERRPSAALPATHSPTPLGLSIFSPWTPSLAPESKATSRGLQANELLSLEALLSCHGRGKRQDILRAQWLTCRPQAPIRASPL